MSNHICQLIYWLEYQLIDIASLSDREKNAALSFSTLPLIQLCIVHPLLTREPISRKAITDAMEGDKVL